MIMRQDIETVLQSTAVTGETPAERNAQRKQAVIEFLSDKPNSSGRQGSVHDMILSDLKSYRGWEVE